MSEEISNRESFSSHDKSSMNAKFREDAQEQSVLINNIGRILVDEIGLGDMIDRLKEIELIDFNDINSYVNSDDILEDVTDLYDEISYYDYKFEDFFYYLLSVNEVLYDWLDNVTIQNSIRNIIDSVETDYDEIGF